MELVDRTLRWQRALLCGLLAASSAGFWRATYDVFNTFKATLIALGTLAIVLVGAYRASRTRRLHLPRSPVVVAAGVLASGLLVATLVSPSPLLSVVGRPGRHSGLAMYLAYLALFTASAGVHRERLPTALAKTLLGTAVPVTAYALLQAAGTDPFGWRLVEGGPPVFSTFGNANFLAAFLGIIVPIAVWGSLTRTWSPPWRAASAVLALAALGAAVVSNSLQGPAIALTGAALVLAVRVGTSAGLGRRSKAALLGGAGAAGILALAAVGAGAGPLRSVRDGFTTSLGTRLPKWETAVAIFRDRPITGVGLERFADYFHEYRSAGLAAQSGLGRTTDTPHNVPLDMLVGGGAVLGLAYLAFVGLTAWALLTGLRRTRGEDRLLLAALGGGWLAYQLQSLVSIDVPPIAVLHYVLAGAVVGLGVDPGWWTVALPGAPLTPGTGGRRGAGTRQGRRAQAPLAPASPPVLAALGLAGAVGLVLVTTPIRADVAAGAGLRLGATNPAAAIAAYERASATAPWESRYPALLGALLATGQVGRPHEALAAHLRAAEREPRSLVHALNVARLASSLGRVGQADQWWETVRRIDPKTPELLAEAGDYWLGRGQVARASRLVEQAVTIRTDDAALWVSLGEIRTAERDTQAARAAFERALQLNPQVEGGAEGLARLDGLA